MQDICVRQIPACDVIIVNWLNCQKSTFVSVQNTAEDGIRVESLQAAPVDRT